MLFSVKTQGFYVGDQWDYLILPDDNVSVSAEAEREIRESITAGKTIKKVSGDVIYYK